MIQGDPLTGRIAMNLGNENGVFLVAIAIAGAVWLDGRLVSQEGAHGPAFGKPAEGAG